MDVALLCCNCTDRQADGWIVDCIDSSFLTPGQQSENNYCKIFEEEECTLKTFYNDLPLIRLSGEGDQRAGIKVVFDFSNFD